MLHRLFPFDPTSGPNEEGGALFVPRPFQGAGRHDNPDRYGALYASRVPAAVVAEHLRPYRRQEVTEQDLRWERRLPYAIVTLDDSRLAGLVDLDDPRTLAERQLRPSRVATRDREATRPLALALFEEGREGFEWWSTIEASWTNVTLFAERAVPKLGLAADPEPLTLDHPAVREAAEAIGLRIEP